MEYQLTQLNMTFIFNGVLHNIDVGRQPEVVEPPNKPS